MISVRWVGMFLALYLERFLAGWDEKNFRSRASHLHKIGERRSRHKRCTISSEEVPGRHMAKVGGGGGRHQLGVNEDTKGASG